MNKTLDRTTTQVSEEELAAHLESAQVPALIMLTAHVTGDTSVLRDEWRPNLRALPSSGLDAEAEAAARAVCFELLAPHLATQNTWASVPSEELRLAMSTWLMGAPVEDALAMSEVSFIPNNTDPRQPRVEARGHCPGHRPERRRHRCRLLRPARRPAPEAGGRPVQDHREEQGRRRHLVGKHLPGLPHRRAQPHLHLLLHPARLGDALRAPGQDPRIPAPVRGRQRPAGAHGLRHRGHRDPLERGHQHLDAGDQDRAGRRGNLRVQHRGQRRGPAQPPLDPEPGRP